MFDPDLELGGQPVMPSSPLGWMITLPKVGSIYPVLVGPLGVHSILQ